MNLLKAGLLVIVAGVLLHHMIWRVGGVGIIAGLLLAGMFVIVAYFWLAMRD